MLRAFSVWLSERVTPSNLQRVAHQSRTTSRRPREQWAWRASTAWTRQGLARATPMSRSTLVVPIRRGGCRLGAMKMVPWVFDYELLVSPGVEVDDSRWLNDCKGDDMPVAQRRSARRMRSSTAVRDGNDLVVHGRAQAAEGSEASIHAFGARAAFCPAPVAEHIRVRRPPVFRRLHKVLRLRRELYGVRSASCGMGSFTRLAWPTSPKPVSRPQGATPTRRASLVSR